MEDRVGANYARTKVRSARALPESEMMSMPAIPAQLPPMFVAWAQDDNAALAQIVRFHEALKAAGYKPEVHIFSSGGHGFGMNKQGKTSDPWLDLFYFWLEAQQLTKPRQTSIQRSA